MSKQPLSAPGKIFWIVFVIGVGLYCAVKFAGPALVTAAYQEQKFTLLNLLTSEQQNHSLEFYLGRVQETVIGPATQILSGILLAVFLLRVFPRAGRWTFGIIVFVFLIFTKFEVLFFPPYGDAIGGPFAEALWLYHNGFDFNGLLQQPSFDRGGQRVYVFSLYPSFLAVCLKLVPSIKAFLVFQHLAVFAMAAAMAAMLRECFLTVLDRTSATLAALVFVSLPLMQSQVEAINMEIPSAFFILWSAYALACAQYGRAGFFAVLSALVKGTGVLACGAAALGIFVVACRARDFKSRVRLLALSAITAGAGAGIVSLKFIFKDAHISEGMVHWAAGWPSLHKEFTLYLFLVCAVGIGLYGIFTRWASREKLANMRVPLVMMAYGSMWFLLFLNFFAVSPRYRVALYPFLVFIVVYAATRLLRSSLVQKAALGLSLVVAGYYSYGVYYGSVPNNDHVLLERSLEYRNDLFMNQRLVKLLEESYSDQTITAPFVLAQILAIPELGYVTKQLDVMIYGFGLKYGGIRNYPGMKNMDLRSTVFVGVHVNPLELGFSYPVHERDLVLTQVEFGNKKATVFRGGYGIELLWRAAKSMK